MIPHLQRGKMIRSQGGGDAARGDSAAAAPVDEGGAGGRAPLAQGEFTQQGVPFPADALGVGQVIAGQIGEGCPIGAGGGTAAEKPGAEAI